MKHGEHLVFLWKIMEHMGIPAYFTNDWNMDLGVRFLTPRKLFDSMGNVPLGQSHGAVITLLANWGSMFGVQ